MTKRCGKVGREWCVCECVRTCLLLLVHTCACWLQRIGKRRLMTDKLPQIYQRVTKHFLESVCYCADLYIFVRLVVSEYFIIVLSG